jgi:proteasome lid subunit RPN8/RPN11
MENSLKFSLNSINFQREGSSIVSITFSALSEMRDLARSSQDIECGGILVGHNVGRDIEVVAASGAGPNAKQSAAHFLRDTGYCREFLARRYQESGADYVGEWHSHVVGLHHLSAGDLNTLVGILVDPDYSYRRRKRSRTARVCGRDCERAIQKTNSYFRVISRQIP